MKTKKTEVTVLPKAAAVIEKKDDVSVESFISQAIKSNVPIETLERLLAMRDKVKAEMAKEAYIAAMARFQAECPIITKASEVKDKYGKHRYNYAKLETIVSQTKDSIASNGFSYRFDEEKDDKHATAICIVTHEAGHSEVTKFKVEIGTEEYMTNVQKYGARMTFAKRYAFCNAFGILTGDEDNDAQEPDEDKKENAIVDWQTRLESAGNMDELKKQWVLVPAALKPVLEVFKNQLKAKHESH